MFSAFQTSEPLVLCNWYWMLARRLWDVRLILPCWSYIAVSLTCIQYMYHIIVRKLFFKYFFLYAWSNYWEIKCLLIFCHIQKRKWTSFKNQPTIFLSFSSLYINKSRVSKHAISFHTPNNNKKVFTRVQFV